MSQKIAIVGAGMGGIAAASLLADRGHTVTIYDQFKEPAPVGSGLVIQPVGQNVLAEIGALDHAITLGNSVVRMMGQEARHGRRVLDVHYDIQGGPNFGLAIHRASLFDALFCAMQTRDIKIVAGTRIVSAQNGTLTDENGGNHGTFDLVVDAAGSGSPLSPLTARKLPYGAVWGTVDWPETTLPQNELRQKYLRASHMIGVLPVGRLPNDPKPKATIFWSLPASGISEWRKQELAIWQDEAISLWPEFEPFAKQITHKEQMSEARYSHGTLRHPYGERIVHIGDAAHRASPQLGQGANMALLDALALAKALDVASGQEALRLYYTARKLHVGIYQAMSAIFTPQYQSDSRFLPALRDNVLFPASCIPPMPRMLTAIVRGTMVKPIRTL